MSNGKNGQLIIFLVKVIQSFIHFAFGIIIQGRSRFIQQQYIDILIQGSSNAKPLLLSAR